MYLPTEMSQRSLSGPPKSGEEPLRPALCWPLPCGSGGPAAACASAPSSPCPRQGPASQAPVGAQPGPVLCVRAECRSLLLVLGEQIIRSPSEDQGRQHVVCLERLVARAPGPMDSPGAAAAPRHPCPGQHGLQDPGRVQPRGGGRGLRGLRAGRAAHGGP